MKRNAILAFIASLAASNATSAQIVYTEDFDSGTAGANWTARVSPGTAVAGADANFAFDYGTVGINSAPNSVGATTTGLRMRVNRPGTAVFSGISAAPNGQTFLGDYILRFDAWQNFNGPFPGGGNGSTQMTGGGIGANTATAQFPGSTIDGVYFSASGDGGSAADYRAYVNPGSPAADVSGVYAAGSGAGSNGNSNAYYSTNSFGLVAAPPDQLLAFPQQTGATNDGTAGMEWHTWTIAKSGNSVTWMLRNRLGVDVLIATLDVTNEPFGLDNNIFLGQFDVNATSSADPNSSSLLFGLFDNVIVTAVPEPSTFALAGLGIFGLVALGGQRRRLAPKQTTA